MIEFEVKSRSLTLGDRKGQTVYYAYPKSQQKVTSKVLVDRIVRESSLSAGDVRNALISLSNVVCEALAQGESIDLADLGSVRLTVPSRMMDSPEEVTVAKALKTPKIIFTPKKVMRDAANSVELSIYRTKTTTGSSSTTENGTTDSGSTESGGGDENNPL